MATVADIKRRLRIGMTIASVFAPHSHHYVGGQGVTIRTGPAHTPSAIQLRRLLRILLPHYLTLRDKVTGEALRVIHNAPFHNAAAMKVKNTPNLKAVFKWPRGHAKSTHFDIFLPLWLMFQPKRLINFMVVVGKSEDSANRLLADIQAELEYNQRIISDFGEQKSAGTWTEGEFKTQSVNKFLAVGRGQSPRGLRDRESRPDYIVIDDLDDDELCRNEKRVKDLTDWVKEALFGALDVGRGRFIMVGNLISKCSVLANLCNTKGCMSPRSRPSTATATRYGLRSGLRRKRRSMPILSASGPGTRR